IPLEEVVQFVPLPRDENRQSHPSAGLVMEYLQRIPQPGEEVQVGDYMIKALQVASHRVQKVQVRPRRGEEEMDFEV
ncbi:transporter associated domain-containing protein, partial [Enterobacter intestinihominis]